MATHKVKMKLNKDIEIVNQDIELVINSNGRKLGKLLISRGNIEWIPTYNSKNKKRLSWEKFDVLMQEEGKRKIIK